MSCYFVARIVVHDPQRYEQYLMGTDAVLEAHEGEVLAVDEDVEVLEGEWECTRTVLIRFPSEASARAWYESPEYRSIAEHRFASASTHAVFVKGRGSVASS